VYKHRTASFATENSVYECKVERQARFLSFEATFEARNSEESPILGGSQTSRPNTVENQIEMAQYGDNLLDGQLGFHPEIICTWNTRRMGKTLIYEMNKTRAFAGELEDCHLNVGPLKIPFKTKERVKEQRPKRGCAILDRGTGGYNRQWSEPVGIWLFKFAQKAQFLLKEAAVYDLTPIPVLSFLLSSTLFPRRRSNQIFCDEREK
jgi:hypothetical protein